jgi:hypothetical protein
MGWKGDWSVSNFLMFLILQFYKQFPKRCKWLAYQRKPIKFTTLFFWKRNGQSDLTHHFKPIASPDRKDQSISALILRFLTSFVQYSFPVPPLNSSNQNLPSSTFAFIFIHSQPSSRNGRSVP